MKQVGKEPRARRRLAVAEIVRAKGREAVQPEVVPSREETGTQEPLPVLSQSAVTEGLERHVPQLRDQILDPAGSAGFSMPIRPSLQKV